LADDNCHGADGVFSSLHLDQPSDAENVYCVARPNNSGSELNLVQVYAHWQFGHAILGATEGQKLTFGGFAVISEQITDSEKFGVNAGSTLSD